MNYEYYIKLFKTGWGFWLQWVFVTLVGFLVSLLWIEIGERPDITALEGAIGGAAIGFAQWLVLRQYLPHVWGWIFTSAIAWGLMAGSDVGALGWVAPRTLQIAPRLVYGIVNGAMVGAVVGVGQWFVMRSQVPQAWRWIFASTVYWGIGLAIGWTCGGVLRLVFNQFLGEVMGLTVTWVLVAGLTGIALILLLRNVVRSGFV